MLSMLHIDVVEIYKKKWYLGKSLYVVNLLVVKNECSILLDRWHRQKPRDN